MDNFSLTHWVIFAIIVYVVWRLFRSKSKPAQKDHDSKPALASRLKNEDTWEGAFWDVANPKPTDVTVHLLYKDAAGQRTKRTVHVRGFEAGAQGLMIGHCALRDATRTFRFDRVERAIDPATGEIIPDLHAWLQLKHESSPTRQREKLAADNIDIFKVLLYVAKADGSMRAAEIAVIANAMVEITDNSDISAETVKIVLKQLDTPTLHGFKLAFGRLTKKDRQTAIKAMHAAEDIVFTQKDVHPAEQASLDYLKKVIASSVPSAATA